MSSLWPIVGKRTLVQAAVIFAIVVFSYVHWGAGPALAVFCASMLAKIPQRPVSPPVVAWEPKPASKWDQWIQSPRG